ncbi:N-acetylmuramoyl-L-alanine amidase [Clostridium rectalis]|uniref:N-acetylmuramoyl-L-alanine amidase n=1 Tax=Clostridium rectalis TaxID=2040295 RepID=UPI000F62DD1A|nr:N-acetylmuramoyl-L-alanine amidase [Clostridium rectalis]
MAIYGIDCGHTMSGADYGAVGIKAESNLTREVGTKVISKLQALGHTVIKCYKDSCSSLNDSLSYRTNTANNNNVDLYVSIHFNCYNGSAYGSEIWTHGGKSFKEASRVLNNIVSLGYANRGIKNGSNLYVIRNTKMKSMLIECCFCDNSSDMDRYNADKMADAIVKGLVGSEIKEQEGEKNEMENIVCYNNQVDKRAAEYLADYLKCPTIDNKAVPFDYSRIKNVYGVGGGKFSCYAKVIGANTDRWGVIKGVLKFCKKL